MAPSCHEEGFFTQKGLIKTGKKVADQQSSVSKVVCQQPNYQIHTLTLIVYHLHLESTYGPALHISALFCSLVSCGYIRTGCNSVLEQTEKEKPILPKKYIINV